MIQKAKSVFWGANLLEIEERDNAGDFQVEIEGIRTENT